MPEYIEREAAITAIRNQPFLEQDSCTFIDSCDAEDVIDSIPAADVAPVVHGRWDKYDWYDAWNCNKCGHIEKAHTRKSLPSYCKCCGAKMDLTE